MILPKVNRLEFSCTGIVCYIRGFILTSAHVAALVIHQVSVTAASVAALAVYQACTGDSVFCRVAVTADTVATFS